MDLVVFGLNWVCDLDWDCDLDCDLDFLPPPFDFPDIIFLNCLNLFLILLFFLSFLVFPLSLNIEYNFFKLIIKLFLDILFIEKFFSNKSFIKVVYVYIYIYIVDTFYE